MNQLQNLFDVPGPRSRRNLAILNTLGALLVGGIVIAIIIFLVNKGQLAAAAWQPFFTAEVWSEYLIPGLLATLKAAVIAIVTSNILGLLLGIGRLSAIAPIRWLCGIIVEFFRAVPVLVMMIFFYFMLSELANRTGVISSSDAPFYGVVLGLTLYNGSVIAELVRSGVYNLPKGQREAGKAIGLRHGQLLRHIELPQALVAMMPAMVSQLVVILKDTALGYIVVYPELLRQAKLVGTSYSNLLPALIVAALIFIIVNTLLGFTADWLQRKLSSRTAGGAMAANAEMVTDVDPSVLVEGD
ncbi:glutamate transport system permease protein [Bowdeniella nasicola]|uniref:Glutamate transport system permease protein n=1 Tax=Bowdeniella nasicola TaxID=208480 RepID=A0A1H4BDI1_9ACTO|nr:amino acid ABC transporter permease [Bowdeniella nasicola]SEA45882.1 glutamate transport system permease protein [Bowdeniella nasicola]